MNQKRVKFLNLDDMILRLQNSQKQANKLDFPLKEEEIQHLCFLLKSISLSQPILIELQPPVIICGDIHGQFRDLLNIIQTIGQPGDRNYLFLGDYVDRGKKSLECYCLLMAYRIKHPMNFFLLRGNHQSSELNKVYGFYDECKRKFSVKLWKSITDTFNYLPIAAVVANRIFCVHGGISPSLKKLQMLNAIKRPIEAKQNNIVSDLLWADPNLRGQGWDSNFERGVSYLYGPTVIDSFLEQNDFDFICRSHQVVEEGYQFFHHRKVLTIFSAPNYCGQFQNFGGVLKISKDLLCSIEQFKGTLTNYRRVERTVTPIKLFSGRRSRQSKEEKQIRSTSTRRATTTVDRILLQNVQQDLSNSKFNSQFNPHQEKIQKF